MTDGVMGHWQCLHCLFWSPACFAVRLSDFLLVCQSCFLEIQVCSPLQDDVMMPQRVRLQHEAALRHPKSVSVDVYACLYNFW